MLSPWYTQKTGTDRLGVQATHRSLIVRKNTGHHAGHTRVMQSTSEQSNSAPSPSSTDLNDPVGALTAFIQSIINPMGFDAVYLELINQRTRLLRVFIDRLQPIEGQSIGIQDCVDVTQALDQPLDAYAAQHKFFGGSGGYELEVSSPGVDRPLRGFADYVRFTGRRIRLNTFRALDASEVENTLFASKYPKQKNFLGVITGVTPSKLQLVVELEGGAKASKKKSAVDRAKEAAKNPPPVIQIPVALIAKANLEPIFEFD
jgi:ribosome maturation factor RimP